MILSRKFGSASEAFLNRISPALMRSKSQRREGRGQVASMSSPIHSRTSASAIADKIDAATEKWERLHKLVPRN
jgi:hypothetical protein